MPARIPLDVDLEDKLLYGLTPMRLAYVVVALLAAFAIWSSHVEPVAMRVALALVVALIGAVAAWGRWRGRAVDGWLVDIFIFVVTNYRFAWRVPSVFLRHRRLA
jgi:hypothetical protein